MRILSVRQPWASLIISGAKVIENRTWATAYRGPVLIHAGGTPAPREHWQLARGLCRHLHLPLPDADPPRGGIVGRVRLVDCLAPDAWPDPWYVPGHFAWLLADAEPLPLIPCAGRLQLYHPSAELMAAITHARPSDAAGSA